MSKKNPTQGQWIDPVTKVWSGSGEQNVMKYSFKDSQGNKFIISTSASEVLRRPGYTQLQRISGIQGNEISLRLGE
jgi:hypothetical protein